MFTCVTRSNNFWLLTKIKLYDDSMLNKATNYSSAFANIDTSRQVKKKLWIISFVKVYLAFDAVIVYNVNFCFYCAYSTIRFILIIWCNYAQIPCGIVRSIPWKRTDDGKCEIRMNMNKQLLWEVIFFNYILRKLLRSNETVIRRDQHDCFFFLNKKTE